MKKKIVALLCAALLVCGVPAAAFADTSEVKADGTATIADPISLAGGTMKNIIFSGLSGVKTVEVKSAPDPSGIPVTAMRGSVSACSISYLDATGMQLASGGMSSKFTFAYQVDDAVIRDLPDGVNADNLYIAGSYASTLQGANVPLTPQPLMSARPESGPTIADSSYSVGVSIDGNRGAGTLTLWVQNGAFAVNPGPATPVPDADSDDSWDDDDDSPRYIDGMPELDVAGTSGVIAWGNLAGANIPAGAAVSIAANAVTSGAAYNDLRAAMGSGRLLGCFQVDLTVNGAQIHNGFGELGLAFPMPYGFEGRTVTVWHLHNDGTITSQVATVRNGEVRITTRDLSEFAIELGAPVSDDANVSPKTGQTIPAGTSALALGAVIALGAVSIVVARRKMTR